MYYLEYNTDRISEIWVRISNSKHQYATYYHLSFDHSFQIIWKTKCD